MKCICNNPAQIKGYGIINIGETIELPDHMINDAIVIQNFKVVPGTVKDKNAKPPKEDEYMKAARKRVLNEIGLDAMRDALIDAHITVNPKWKADKILDLYIEQFGVLEERQRTAAPEEININENGERQENGERGETSDELPLKDPTDPGNGK